MRRTKSLYALASTLLLTLFFTAPSSAQLSTNPDKFLGNITTYYNVDYGNEKYYTLWNQITPENETKWQSIQGSGRNSWNWNDAAYDYAKKYGFPFKFHTLVWGSQYPSWMNDLSTSDQTKAIKRWFDETKKHYPDLDMIDVVNEAISGHAPAPFKNALGGDGVTGYDWIIKKLSRWRMNAGLMPSLSITITTLSNGIQTSSLTWSRHSAMPVRPSMLMAAKAMICSIKPVLT